MKEKELKVIIMNYLNDIRNEKVLFLILGFIKNIKNKRQ